MSTYHLDYETRSRADLKKVGAYRYAADPSTRILMFAIARDEGEPLLWDCLNGGKAALAMLQEALADNEALFWAHNAEFERAISKYRMKADLGLDPPPVEKWRCTAALARKAGLRSSLANVGEDLNLGQKKFGEGYQLIRLFSIPQKATGEFIEPHDQPDKFLRFGEYCLQDVRSEREVHAALKPFELKSTPLETFLFDARMNDRGIPVNVAALRHAKKIIEEVQTSVSKEFVELTGLQPTQRDKVKNLLESIYGVKLTNMQSKTLDEAIAYHEEAEEEEWEAEAEPDNAIARRILFLYKQVSFAAVKKVQTMLDCVCDDGFIRGMFLYHGAGTGRWTGQKVQPQNFRRPTIKDADGVYALLCRGASAEELEMVYGNPLEAIANCIRNFIHDITCPMFDVDYAAIEARIICWLAGQEDALERFRKGIDSYCYMASIIYNRSMDQIKNPSPERELGKRTVLGCGFGMWWPKFQKTAWDQGRVRLPDELAERAVLAYRDSHSEVVQFWDDCDAAARLAIATPNRVFKAGRVTFRTIRVGQIPYMLMALPSGRNLAYPHPRIEKLEGDDRHSITYYGQLPGTTKYGRVKLYGGKLAENATQATAADLMAHGAVTAEKRGHTIWGLVHDQALGRAYGPLESFVSSLTDLPSWAEGLPIKAEGKIVPYYKK